MSGLNLPGEPLRDAGASADAPAPQVPHHRLGDIPMKPACLPISAILLTTALGAWNAAMAAQPEAAPEAVVVAGEQVKQIMPGMLEGYLSKEEQLDSKAFVPPAPAEESARQALDTAWSEQMLKLREMLTDYELVRQLQYL